MTLAIDGRSLQGAQGGIDVYIRQLLTHLCRIDTANRYIIFFNGSHALRRDYVHPSWNVKIIHTRIPSKLLNASYIFFGRPFLDILIERAAGEKIDAFFLPNMNFAAFSPNARIALVVHDFSFMYFQKTQSLKSRIWHRAVRPESLLARANAVIAVSKNSKKDACALYHLSHDSVSVVPLGIEDEFRSSEATRIDQLPCIIAFCPQEGRKNITALVEAFVDACSRYEEMRGMTLVLAGATRMPRDLANFISALPHGVHIKIIPYLPLARRSKLIQSSRLCVYPSVYEGFGMPPFEACALGIPVIAGAHSSIPEVSGNAVWYCDPYNVRELSESLIRVTTDEVLRRSLIYRGGELAKTYSWERTAEQTLHILNSL